MKNRNPDIDHYFKYRQCLAQAKETVAQLETSVYIIEHLIEYHFNDTEKYIFEQHLVQKRRLIDIANDLNYSYGYTRQILLHSRNKLDLLLFDQKKNNH